MNVDQLYYYRGSKGTDTQKIRINHIFIVLVLRPKELVKALLQLQEYKFLYTQNPVKSHNAGLQT